MTEQPQASSPSSLSEDEKALLRRCYRVRRITDEEIVFRIEPASGKAAWFTMFWFLMMGGLVVARWADVPHDAPSAAWILLGVFPVFLFTWLVGRMPCSLIVKRGARSMNTVFHDGAWTIKLPSGSSPAEWGFPTASVPVRPKSDEVERATASEILERFSGSSLAEPRGDSFLPLLDQCAADVVGCDDQSISIANFGSARQWVVATGVSLFVFGPFGAAFWMFFVSDQPKTLLWGGLASALGAAWVMFDGRASSVATFLKGKRKVRLQHRGEEQMFDVHEDAVGIGGENNDYVAVGQAFSCSPRCGTQQLLAAFFRKYLSPPRVPPKPMTDT